MDKLMKLFWKIKMFVLKNFFFLRLSSFSLKFAFYSVHMQLYYYSP